MQGVAWGPGRQARELAFARAGLLPEAEGGSPGSTAQESGCSCWDGRVVSHLGSPFSSRMRHSSSAPGLHKKGQEPRGGRAVGYSAHAPLGARPASGSSCGKEGPMHCESGKEESLKRRAKATNSRTTQRIFSSHKFHPHDLHVLQRLLLNLLEHSVRPPPLLLARQRGNVVQNVHALGHPHAPPAARREQVGGSGRRRPGRSPAGSVGPHCMAWRNGRPRLHIRLAGSSRTSCLQSQSRACTRRTGRIGSTTNAGAVQPSRKGWRSGTNPGSRAVAECAG